MDSTTVARCETRKFECGPAVVVGLHDGRKIIEDKDLEWRRIEVGAAR